MAFTVLLVCTANMCRSPLAAAIFARAVDQIGLDWQVTSAGTAAVEGAAVHELTLAVLAEAGVEPLDRRTHVLTRDVVRSADLVLTAAGAHRQAVVARDVGALRRTFTLRQFARWSRQISLSTLDSALLGPDLVAGALQARSLSQPGSARTDDVPDPITGTMDTFRACRDLVAEAVGQILEPVRAAVP